MDVSEKGSTVLEQCLAEKPRVICGSFCERSCGPRAEPATGPLSRRQIGPAEWISYQQKRAGDPAVYGTHQTFGYWRSFLLVPNGTRVNNQKPWWKIPKLPPILRAPVLIQHDRLGSQHLRKCVLSRDRPFLELGDYQHIW